MKKLSSKMKILLVLAVCAGMMVPAMASAADVKRLALGQGTYELGEHTVTVPITSFTTGLEFDVINGDPSTGKNRVSSVKIVARDAGGELDEVALSPSLFSQDVGSGVATFRSAALKVPTSVDLDIKVKGPKGGYFKMIVYEYYNWMSPTGPGSWIQ